MKFTDLSRYYSRTARLPLDEKVEVMPTSAGITVLSGDGGVLQTSKQAAACKRIFDICSPFADDVELSQEIANSVQSILGGCTLRKATPEIALSVVVASATDVPTISKNNNLSARGRNLAEFCKIAADAAEANGINGQEIFNALKEAIKESEIVTATWLGKADLSSAKTTVKTERSRRVVEVEEDEYVPSSQTQQQQKQSKLKPDPAKIGG